MRKLDHQKALVLFSGGQDSSIALAWALERFASVETIGFNYSQRHAVELGARQTIRREINLRAPKLAEKLAGDTIINAASIAELGETALTHDAEIAMSDDGLPTTFVPGRNLVFLTLASGFAYRRNIGVLVAGMCEADSSGYPDCREAALNAQIEAIRLGTDTDMSIETPLMHIDKAASWRMAEEIGGIALVNLINEHSHTCYLGLRAERHEWGYGCGTCPACELRARGWRDYASDR